MGFKNAAQRKAVWASRNEQKKGSPAKHCASDMMHSGGWQEMRKHKVGIQRYTFENDPLEMVMHLFRIHLDDERVIQNIRGCEEISPRWFEDWYKIPLDNMFADDSHWLTALLASPKPLEINGWYHFRENCQETNTVLHYYMDVKPKESFTEKEADQQI